MNQALLNRIAKLGLTLSDFERQPTNDKERIAQLEQIIEEQSEALIELAEMISEVADNG